MKKYLLVFLIIFFSAQLTFSQTTKYGYQSRDRANQQVDWGKIGKDVSDRIIKIGKENERAARELGWSSVAEMNAARKKKKRQLRNDRKVQKLEYRLDKRKKRAELRRIKKEERLKRKNKKPNK